MKPRGRVIKLGVWRRCRNRRRRRQQTRGAREETTDVVWRAHSGRRRVPAFMWLFYCFLPVGRVVTTSAAQEENSNSSRLQAALEASHNIWASSRDQRHRHSFSWAGPAASDEPDQDLKLSGPVQSWWWSSIRHKWEFYSQLYGFYEPNYFNYQLQQFWHLAPKFNQRFKGLVAQSKTIQITIIIVLISY